MLVFISYFGAWAQFQCLIINGRVFVFVNSQGKEIVDKLEVSGIMFRWQFCMCRPNVGRSNLSQVAFDQECLVWR